MPANSSAKPTIYTRTMSMSNGVNAKSWLATDQSHCGTESKCGHTAATQNAHNIGLSQAQIISLDPFIIDKASPPFIHKCENFNCISTFCVNYKHNGCLFYQTSNHYCSGFFRKEKFNVSLCRLKHVLMDYRR